MLCLAQRHVRSRRKIDLERDMEETFGLKDYSDDKPVSSRDPVCGAIVEEDKAPAKMEYDGEMLYFCSNDCKKKFDNEPELYFGPPSAPSR